MRHIILPVLLLGGSGLLPLAAGASDADQLRTGRDLGYSLDGQVHEDPSLPVRAIVHSSGKALPDIDGQPQSELTYRVCNVDTGDPGAKRAPAKLYFRWPDAGFGTSLQRELPVEYCALLVRHVSAPVKTGTSKLLYTYRSTPIPALSVWMVDLSFPWTLQPKRYWEYGVALYENATQGQSNPQRVFRVATIRKTAADTAAYRILGWKRGTELYLALPRLSPEARDRYRSALGQLESRGVRFSIRPGEQAAQDFNNEPGVAAGFAGREVLKVDVSPERETDNAYQEYMLTVPVADTDLIELPVVVRERSSGQALYQASYVTAGM